MIAEHVERFNRGVRSGDFEVLLDGDGSYARAKEPEIPAGQMFLTERDGEIAQLVIRYDR